MVLKPNKILKKFFNAYQPNQIDAMVDLLNMLIPHGVDGTELTNIAKPIALNKRRRGVLDPEERKRFVDERKKDRQRRLKKEALDKWIEQHDKPMALIGFCECGGLLGGEVIQKCGNNRIFYKECDTCEYYAELIQHSPTEFEDLVQGGLIEEEPILPTIVPPDWKMREVVEEMPTPEHTKKWYNYILSLLKGE